MPILYSINKGISQQSRQTKMTATIFGLKSFTLNVNFYALDFEKPDGQFCR